MSLILPGTKAWQQAIHGQSASNAVDLSNTTVAHKIDEHQYFAGNPFNMAISPDGTDLIIASSQGFAHYEMTTAGDISTISGYGGVTLNAKSSSSFGALVTVSRGCHVKADGLSYYNVDNGNRVIYQWTYNGTDGTWGADSFSTGGSIDPRTNSTSNPTDCYISPDGTKLVALNSVELEAFDLPTPHLINGSSPPVTYTTNPPNISTDLTNTYTAGRGMEMSPDGTKCYIFAVRSSDTVFGLLQLGLSSPWNVENPTEEYFMDLGSLSVVDNVGFTIDFNLGIIYTTINAGSSQNLITFQIQ